jgi:hypothetical protein
MREGKVVGSHVVDALSGILILDIGHSASVSASLWVQVSVYIVGAVGFGNCEA